MSQIKLLRYIAWQL